MCMSRARAGRTPTCCQRQLPCLHAHVVISRPEHVPLGLSEAAIPDKCSRSSPLLHTGEVVQPSTLLFKEYITGVCSALSESGVGVVAPPPPPPRSVAVYNAIRSCINDRASLVTHTDSLYSFAQCCINVMDTDAAQRLGFFCPELNSGLERRRRRRREVVVGGGGSTIS